MQITKQNDTIEQFYTLIMQGVAAWTKAGELVAKACEEDDDFPAKVNAAHPEITEEFVLVFERVGRRLVHPKLLMDDSPGVEKLRSLPYAEQEKWMTCPVPLLVRAAKGWETLRTPVRNLTQMQARQVFARHCVRSEGEQRAWLEGQSALKSVPADDAFRVVGGKLVVMHPTTLTRKQVAQCLAMME